MIALGFAAACATFRCELPRERPVPPLQVAFLADVHLQDVYGQLGDFAGVPSRVTGRSAALRTMYAQLTSTRLFNESYFALRAALDDAYARGVRLVALPGDATDDGQPVNVAGLKVILAEYTAKGMRFFLTPGNHDPRKPFDDEGFKDDFLGVGGTNQRIHSTGSGPCRGTGRSHLPDREHPTGPDIVCTEQIKRLGYHSLLDQLAAHGYQPSSQDLYWESPFSTTSGPDDYTYAAARREATFSNRQFEICHEGEGGKYKQPGYTSCTLLPDASYLVEPVPGLWLLAIDANVYQPKDAAHFDSAHPQQPDNFAESSDAGYNAVLTHKRHLIDWLTRVAQRAHAQGKQLVAFSHFPMSEFYNGQSPQLAALFLPGAFQLARRPLDATTRALAATGLQLHIAGHMHLNNTGVHVGPGGEFLVNIQAPALGVFGAAYKLVTLLGPHQVDVQTITLTDVPRFRELFEHYETEWQRLRTSTAREDADHLWPHELLASPDYPAFTRRYFGELARLRFLDSYWPCTLREAVRQLDAAQLLILSQLHTRVTLAQLKDVADVVPLTARCTAAGVPADASVAPSQLREDWAAATRKASQRARAAGLHLDDFASLTAYEIYGDFHRVLYAGELAQRDLGSTRRKLYQVLLAAFPRIPAPIVKVADKPSDQNAVPTVFQDEFAQLLRIFDALLSGAPSDHFVIDLQRRTVIRADAHR